MPLERPGGYVRILVGIVGGGGWTCCRQAAVAGVKDRCYERGPKECPGSMKIGPALLEVKTELEKMTV
jgi:hypothetical protein